MKIFVLTVLSFVCVVLAAPFYILFIPGYVLSLIADELETEIETLKRKK